MAEAEIESRASSDARGGVRESSRKFDSGAFDRAKKRPQKRWRMISDVIRMVTRLRRNKAEYQGECEDTSS